MSHLHLVDGVISPLWWITGYVLALGILVFAASRIKKNELSMKVPFIGITGALMLICMSVPLGFLPVHLNLTVLAGILAGPWVGYIAVFIVNIILALIGHGGITVIGLNTLLIGTEVILGHYLFKAVKKWIKPVAAAAIAVFVTLLVSTTFILGIIALTGTGLVHGLMPGSLEHGHPHIFEVSGWGTAVFVLLVGIALEVSVTSLIVAFFLKVRPDMISDKSSRL